MDVIAIFDIGKTNKKFLLYSKDLHVVHQEETAFEEVKDDDGFACDDIESLEAWMVDRLTGCAKNDKYRIKAINITTYGATLMYLDENGKRLTPVYNYLKPMPEDVLEGFYERYGGVEEFSRKTASPALGMLNSGLQILWLKKNKPAIFQMVTTILHFPQYLSYLFTGKITSEYTSLGCHTAMWDFDNNQYHQWIHDEEIRLPTPVSNSTLYDETVNGYETKTGIGIHDSSASLVPYIAITREPFILISTGTWCIFMNPFNEEPLTTEQLRKDSLCYMSIRQQQVKSSRLFLGYIHDINVEVISRHFGISKEFYKNVKASGQKIIRLSKKKERHFFKNGVPSGYVDHDAVLNHFLTFDEAYHQLMSDLVDISIESLSLVIASDDRSKTIYISGGFARNELFIHFFAARLPDKKVYTSEVDNATALGAAMAVYEGAFGAGIPEIDLGLKLIAGF